MGTKLLEKDKMKEKKGVENKSNGFRLIGYVLSSTPSLVFKAGCWFLKFKHQANKGGRVFRNELLKNGFDKTSANELTDIYLKPSDLGQYITFLR